MQVQTLASNMTKFLKTILELFDPLPSQLVGCIRNMNSYLYSYRSDQSHLMEAYIGGLERKLAWRDEDQSLQQLQANKENLSSWSNKLDLSKKKSMTKLKFIASEGDYTNRISESKELTVPTALAPRRSREGTSSSSSLKIKLKPRPSQSTLMKENAASLLVILQANQPKLQEEIQKVIL